MFKAVRLISLMIAILIFCISALVLCGYVFVPDSSVTSKESICFNGLFYAQAAERSGKNENSTAHVTAEVKLMKIIPVKNITLLEPERRYVIPGGELIGIKLQTAGIVVIGTEFFSCGTENICPALEAGICVGDIITELNGESLVSATQFSNAIKECNGNALRLKIIRNNQAIQIILKPQKSLSSEIYKGGLWIRDSLGGIGTLTYTDIKNGTLAALGHGIYDTDTKTILPSKEGAIYSANVSSVVKGASGKAGQICGNINTDSYGSLITNTEQGIYGYITGSTSADGALPVAFTDEVHTGTANILCTVSNGEKKSYTINIDKVDASALNGKAMIISVTDTALLATTGGIVQGMSGSPIIQDGKLVGAVTHVFLNDPTKGYGILATEMLEHSDALANNSALPTTLKTYDEAA